MIVLYCCIYMSSRLVSSRLVSSRLVEDVEKEEDRVESFSHECMKAYTCTLYTGVCTDGRLLLTLPGNSINENDSTLGHEKLWET